MKTNETCGRYEIEVSGPDALTNNCFWIRVRSSKSRLGRTPNNFVTTAMTIEEAGAKVAAFKSSKGLA